MTGFAAAGEYTLVYTNGNCQDEMIITVGAKEIAAGVDQSVECFVEGTATMAATGNGTWTIVSGVAVITDANNANTTVAGFDSAGTVELMWSDANCNETVIITVGDDCPCDIAGNNLIDDLNDLYCEDAGSITIIGSEATPAGGTYQWIYSTNGVDYNPAPGINNGKDYDFDQMTEQFNYFKRAYIVSENPLCSDTSEVVDFRIFNTKFTPGAIISDPVDVCLGDSVTLYIEDYDARFNYTWSITRGRGATIIQEDSMIMILAQSSGTLSVSVTQTVEVCGADMISLPSTADIVVNALPQPFIGADTIVCDFSESFEVFAGEWEGGVVWQDGSEDEYFDIEEKGTYEVMVTDSMGCVGKDVIRVTSNCCEFDYPNVMNVSSQVGNNEFKVTDIYDCTITNKISIFDRWGNMVYQSDDASIPWDGVYKGQFAEMGVYVFLFEYTAYDGDDNLYEGQVKGDVTVLKK